MSELREATKVQLGDGKENGSQRGVGRKTLGMEAEQSVVQGFGMAYMLVENPILQSVLSSYSCQENRKPADSRRVPLPLAPFLLPVLPFSKMSSYSFWIQAPMLLSMDLPLSGSLCLDSAILSSESSEGPSGIHISVLSSTFLTFGLNSSL